MRIASILAIAAVTVPLTVLVQFAGAQENTHPGEALYGEWIIQEMIFKGVDQEASKYGGWVRIKKDSFELSTNSESLGAKCPCTIRPGEMDIKTPWSTIKALYELKDGRLWIAWMNNFNGERPTNFDALKDPRLTLYVLKKRPAK